MFEMLASNKTPDADYIRLQRAQILKVLSSNGKNLSQIQTQLKNREINLSESAIQDHLSGLKSVGINIVERSGNYRLADKIIKLEIPRQISRTDTDKSELKDKVRDKLKTVNHKYLSLIDLAYSNASTKTKKNSDAREFEIQTAELFTKELNFSGMRLGDSNRPDIIIFLQYIFKTKCGIIFATIGVENLLYLAENLKSGKISHSDFYSKFNNSEIICNQ